MEELKRDDKRGYHLTSHTRRMVHKFKKFGAQLVLRVRRIQKRANGCLSTFFGEGLSGKFAKEKEGFLSEE